MFLQWLAWVTASLLLYASNDLLRVESYDREVRFNALDQANLGTRALLLHATPSKALRVGQGNPFQPEVGFANLALGILGIVAMGRVRVLRSSRRPWGDGIMLTVEKLGPNFRVECGKGARL